MIKAGKSYEDIYNYRNSRYFAQTVKNARNTENNKNLVIFAGACQSYYEALIDCCRKNSNNIVKQIFNHRGYRKRS